MKFAVLHSKKDLAGKNIIEQLKNHFVPQMQVIELNKLSIYNENIDKDPRLKDVDFIIFATTHRSKAGTSSLSLHAPGNWRNADLGGKPSKVCPTSSLALKYLFQKLNENTEKSGIKNYEVTLECTHHGPYLEKPCCFIEIGCGEKQWQDKEAGKIIAKTIADFQNFKPNRKIKTAVGIGGPHYCPNFNKIQFNQDNNIAISHVIPEYQLPLTKSIIEEAITKTKEHTDLILLDWKAIGKSEQRQQIIEILEELGLEYERTGRIEK